MPRALTLAVPNCVTALVLVLVAAKVTLPVVGTPAVNVTAAVKVSDWP